MLYDVNTPAEYFDALEDDWRKTKLLEVRSVLLNAGPELEEVINYKMLGYQLNDKVICNLNAQKGSVNFYVGDILKVDPSGELLADYNVGKGCIRLSKTKSATAEPFVTFVAKLMELARKGADLSC